MVYRLASSSFFVKFLPWRGKTSLSRRQKGERIREPTRYSPFCTFRKPTGLPYAQKIGWRGFASRVKSFFRFLFSRKKERELPFS